MKDGPLLARKECLLQRAGSASGASGAKMMAVWYGGMMAPGAVRACRLKVEVPLEGGRWWWWARFRCYASLGRGG